MRQAFIASAYTNRGGCVRRRCLERCGHDHRTYEAAARCAANKQRVEKRARRWRVDRIVWRST
jgi:hypothetical protein